MELKDISKNSIIYIDVNKNNNSKEEKFIFRHLDGLYSYCEMENNKDKIINLSRFTPLKAYKDGYKVISKFIEVK